MVDKTTIYSLRTSCSVAWNAFIFLIHKPHHNGKDQCWTCLWERAFQKVGRQKEFSIIILYENLRLRFNHIVCDGGCCTRSISAATVSYHLTNHSLWTVNNKELKSKVTPLLCKYCTQPAVVLTHFNSFASFDVIAVIDGSIDGWWMMDRSDLRHFCLRFLANCKCRRCVA